MNGVSFVPPTVPVLLQIMSGTRAQDLLPSGSVYPVRLNSSVEIVVPGGVFGGAVSMLIVAEYWI